jgi:hypothetical protein
VENFEHGVQISGDDNLVRSVSASNNEQGIFIGVNAGPRGNRIEGSTSRTTTRPASIAQQFEQLPRGVYGDPVLELDADDRRVDERRDGPAEADLGGDDHSGRPAAPGRPAAS